MEKSDRVYILKSSYKGAPPENVGLYDSPAALVTGLSTAVAAGHQGENIMKVARAVGLAVYDFVSATATQPGEKLPPSDRAACRDRDTAYCWESDVVRSAARDQEGAEAESGEGGKETKE
jgi:hypothetical protein